MKVIASPNIAFMKYWGKREYVDDDTRNTPLNPSLSLTLSRARTEVVLREAPTFEFVIQKKPASEKDVDKIEAHIKRVEKFLGRPLKPFHLDSSNNFPTGTGIASSASSFAALTCAFLAWDLGLAGAKELLAKNPQGVADLARRGSGSACRSLHGPFVEWWEREIKVHESSWKLFDTIVIFSKTEKKVSSTEGHKYAVQSPLFPRRLEALPARMQAMKNAIAAKNLQALGPLLEVEAEEMHTIMRENPNPVEYQLPETKAFLAELTKIAGRDFFYTLDAGPNAHIISERPIKTEIESLLKKMGLEADVWEDEVGYGPIFS